MTDKTELAQHRQANGFGRHIARGLLILSNVVMFVALSILFYQQNAYQECQARFDAYDSMARSQRADASYAADKAQQKAFGAAAKLIDPESRATITPQDVLDARDAFRESSTIADRYDDAVKKYPYKNFKKECLS